MQDLMDFAVITELLSLDARDKKRNQLLLSAVSEEICLYLDRNLLMETSTEYQETIEGQFVPREYPVREFIAIEDSLTGEKLELHPDSKIKELTRSDAHRMTWYQLDTTVNQRIKITYRHGYDFIEIPTLIQDTILKRIRTRLILAGQTNTSDQKNDDTDPLACLLPYRRVYLR